MSAVRMTCDECEWTVIAASQNACNSEARRHPHSTTSRVIAAADLIDVELGSGAEPTPAPAAEEWRNRATAIKIWNDAFYVETPGVSGAWYSHEGALALAFVWIAIETFWDMPAAVDAWATIPEVA